MKEEVKVKLDDIESLKKIEKNLKEEISKLQKIQDNLDSQEHSKKLRNEQSEKFEHQEKMSKYVAEGNRIEAKRIAIEQRIDTAEALERNVKDRLKMVEQREQKLIDIDKKIADLNNQRSNFEAYKIKMNAQLDQAKETINEAQEAFDKIESEKMMLAGREAKIKEQEKYWNDTIGQLEADRKAFQMEKENLEGLKKEKN